MASVRSFLEHLPLPAGCTDRRGRIRWMNAAAARLHGSTPAKLVGVDIRALWPHAPVPGPRAPETRVEHAIIGGRSVWLRITRFPVGREVVAVSEEIGDTVELGAAKSLAWLLTRDGRRRPEPDALTAAIGRAFAGKRDAADIADGGAMASEIAMAAVRLLL